MRSKWRRYESNKTRTRLKNKINTEIFYTHRSEVDKPLYFSGEANKTRDSITAKWAMPIGGSWRCVYFGAGRR